MVFLFLLTRSRHFSITSFLSALDCL
jgi:hypothetical protein